MATAAGLNLPAVLAEGVAARLNAAAAEAEYWRPLLGEDAEPFTHFELGAPSAPTGDDTRGQTPSKPTTSAVTRMADRLDTLPRSPEDAGDLMEIAAGIQERTVSPLELTEHYLQQIEALNPKLIAYLTVSRERALGDAQRAEQDLASGIYRGPLQGVPIAHKDLIATKGVRTTYHTDHFKEHVPDVDAPVVALLAEAGSVLLGKANTLELGSGDGDVFGLARNPWDPERQVGGSSSGSAVAVAAGLAVAATGTDAGGSIRIPAAFCGVVGLKPTAGLVDMGKGRNGLSVTGPMTRNVLDAAVMLEAMTGLTGMVERVTGDMRGLTVGVPVDWIDVPLEDEVAATLHRSVDLLRSLGAGIHEVRLPHAAASEVLGGVITHVDCFGKYRFLLDSGARLGRFVHELLLAAELYPASSYLTAQKLRRLMLDEVASAHQQVDVMISPVVPYRAARLDQSELRIGETTVNPRTGQGRFTRLSNLTGYPSLSVPTGLDTNGMPLAVQLHGRPFEEATLLRVARAVELNNPQRSTRPRFHASF